MTPFGAPGEMDGPTEPTAPLRPRRRPGGTALGRAARSAVGVVVLAAAPAAAAPLAAVGAPTLGFGDAVAWLEVGTGRVALGARWGGPAAGQWGVHAGIDPRDDRFEAGFEAGRPLGHGRRSSGLAGVVVDVTWRGRTPGLAAWPTVAVALGVGRDRRLTLEVAAQGLLAGEVFPLGWRAGIYGRAGAVAHLSPVTSLAARGRIGLVAGPGRPGPDWEAGGALAFRF